MREGYNCFRVKGAGSRSAVHLVTTQLNPGASQCIQFPTLQSAYYYNYFLSFRAAPYWLFLQLQSELCQQSRTDTYQFIYMTAVS